MSLPRRPRSRSFLARVAGGGPDAGPREDDNDLVAPTKRGGGGADPDSGGPAETPRPSER